MFIRFSVHKSPSGPISVAKVRFFFELRKILAKKECAYIIDTLSYK